MRLLLIEDDAILGEGLRDFLRAEGHHVDWAVRLLDARALLNEPYDALLVDWQLPDGSGLDLVRRLRREGDDRPMLMLTARDLLKDRLEGLDSGADDYLIKPFDPEELVARLHAVRRRRVGAPTGVLHLGDVDIDLAACAAWRHQGAGRQRVDLTAREWAVLEALAARSGRLVSKSDLEALILGAEHDVQSNVLEVYIGNLRRKLGRERIETVRGMGYRLVAGSAA